MNFDKSNYKERIVDEYNRKVTNYGNGKIEVTAYNQPQIRLLGNFNHKGGANSQSVISDEAQEQRTLKQSYAIKRRIRGYALANDFEWFVTLTIDPKKNDSFDYDYSKNLLLKWCRFMRDTYDKFDYLIIPEFHKSGAIHFHGLLGNISANFVEATHTPIMGFHFCETSVKYTILMTGNMALLIVNKLSIQKKQLVT